MGEGVDGVSGRRFDPFESGLGGRFWGGLFALRLLTNNLFQHGEN